MPTKNMFINAFSGLLKPNILFFPIMHSDDLDTCFKALCGIECLIGKSYLYNTEFSTSDIISPFEKVIKNISDFKSEDNAVEQVDEMQSESH